MVTIPLHCPHCQSEMLVRNGHAPQWQTALSLPCVWTSKPREPHAHAYPEARREEILCAYQERSSLRGLTRTFGVARTTVSLWIKNQKSICCPPEAVIISNSLLNFWGT